MSQTPAESQSVVTVLVAGAVNLAIAAAKLIAGVLSGSAAMVSEAAHSAADTVTEGLLYIALRSGSRPADRNHPFGYGHASYLWAALAAAFTFVAGGLFSITHGFHSMDESGETDFLVSYTVLAVAFVLESVSFIRAVVQVRTQSRRWRMHPRALLHHTPDTSLKAVFLEDAAALIGLLIAAVGLGLTEATGDPVFDGIASVLIGALLLAVAVDLGWTNLSLLIGRAVPDRLRDQIMSALEEHETVESVEELLTLQLGPSSVLVAARVDFADTASGAAIERASRQAETLLRQRYPSIQYVFLTPYGDAGESDAAGEP